jgi:hypothetical protein
MTAGLTYELRATAGVLPSSLPTRRITAGMTRFASRSDSGGPRSASAIAAVFRAKVEHDAVAAHAHVVFAQGGDAVGARFARVALGADAEPACIDQPRRECRDAEPVERVVRQVLGGRRAKVREAFGETGQPVELRLFLLGTEVRVVQVLPPAGGSIPVACSFAPALGEIQTSFHAGGITSARCAGARRRR